MNRKRNDQSANFYLCQDDFTPILRSSWLIIGMLIRCWNWSQEIFEVLLFEWEKTTENHWNKRCVTLVCSSCETAVPLRRLDLDEKHFRSSLQFRNFTWQMRAVRILIYHFLSYEPFNMDFVKIFVLKKIARIQLTWIGLKINLTGLIWSLIYTYHCCYDDPNASIHKQYRSKQWIFPMFMKIFCTTRRKWRQHVYIANRHCRR